MSVRLLHSADLHLDAPLRALAMSDPELRERVATASRGAFERLVRYCIEEDVRALLLAGDVFDRTVQSVNAVVHFAWQMERLDEAGVQVFIIHGNHDYENQAAGKLRLPPNVVVFGDEGGSASVDSPDAGAAIHVHGLSYGARSAPHSLVGDYPAPIPGAVNIGLLHTSLSSASGHDRYAPCSLEQLAAHGYDYWALGHIHGRAVYRENPWVVMPGSPQGRHIGESGPKTATEITLIDGAVADVREIPTAEVVFDRIDVRVNEDNADDFGRLCRRAIEKRAESLLASGQTLVVRIRATGETQVLRRLRHHAALWSERVGQAARDLDYAWLERLDFAVVPTPAPLSGGVGGPIAEISRAMRDNSSRIAIRHRLREILDESLDLLPPAEKKAVAPDDATFEALLDELGTEGTEEIAAAFVEEAEEKR